MNSLKQELEKYHDRKKMGGFVTKKSMIRDHFPIVNGQSREVVLKLNSDIDEPVTVHNIYFEPKKLSLITGEIADQILRDFGGFFTVVAATQIYDKTTNTTGFFELNYDEATEKFIPKKKGSVAIRFDRDKLGLMSGADRSAVIEAKKIAVKALEVARIAKINSEALKAAGITIESLSQ